MKKVFYLMAVALLLLTATWETAVSRANPYNYSDVYTDGGEDHPWGGEQNHDDGAGIRTTTTSDSHTLTGISAIDMYLFKIYSSWFMSGTASPTHSTIWWIVPSSTTPVTSDKPTDPNTQTTTTTTTATTSGSSRNN